MQEYDLECSLQVSDQQLALAVEGSPFVTLGVFNGIETEPKSKLVQVYLNSLTFLGLVDKSCGFKLNLLTMPISLSTNYQLRQCPWVQGRLPFTDSRFSEIQCRYMSSLIFE